MLDPVPANILKQCTHLHSFALILLPDLSAAFDTASHDILLESLSTRFGNSRSALAWFGPYSKHRNQGYITPRLRYLIKGTTFASFLLQPQLFSPHQWVEISPEHSFFHQHWWVQKFDTGVLKYVHGRYIRGKMWKLGSPAEIKQS